MKRSFNRLADMAQALIPQLAIAAFAWWLAGDVGTPEWAFFYFCGAWLWAIVDA